VMGMPPLHGTYVCMRDMCVPNVDIWVKIINCTIRLKAFVLVEVF